MKDRTIAGIVYLIAVLTNSGQVVGAAAQVLALLVHVDLINTSQVAVVVLQLPLALVVQPIQMVQEALVQL